MPVQCLVSGLCGWGFERVAHGPDGVEGEICGPGGSEAGGKGVEVYPL